ncbi:hypothetical protein BARRETLEMON_5 [Arthrobacter phage BarretLemon]|uniref:Uncharacterized protein n=4 Tax=Marthavirus barretlemon TaxID=2560300 RepID=A0A386KM90_9CAUD|nr:immunity protein [Arthrobacter phage BarretLemon]AMM44468.1 hypothetical protein BARRETLEMON_5 [Arthrobacter phage BarretLemon]ASR78035.1 hypothetical protein SEA_TIMINATOR_5 [Arthrobacter phage Timinator]AYD86476.1 hypothetical protein SEA_LEEROYJ_5 [Arthrobacter phage LeeroyJ]QJD53335.1 hypothetical protein SEA_STEVIEBAY_5 [Arthrobacter phage StevieBAY]
MLTQAQAVEQAKAELGKDWDERRGTFDVAIELEDDQDFVVIAGAREWLVDQNLDYATYDDSFYWMDKRSGELREGSQMNEPDITKMSKTRRIDGKPTDFDESDDEE